MRDKTERMTAAELRQLHSAKPMPPRQPDHRESDLQITIVQFLEIALPDDATYFHVPNGGKRDEVTGGILKAMGMRAGVADLIVLWRGYALSVELKTDDGKLSDAQDEWAEICQQCDVPHTVARSLRDVYLFLLNHGIALRAHPA